MKKEEEDPLIFVKGIEKSFGKNKIFTNTNFELKKGEVIGFVGPSGSGKSVFLKILLGFFKPDKGTIQKKQKLKIGFSLQENPIYPYLTVEQNLNYFSKINDIPRKEKKKRIDSLLKELDIEKYRKILFKNLSGGTRKRVDIACSLLEDPEVLILDEPFLGLDPGLVRQLGEFIEKLNKSGVSIIISSHRINELEKICDRFIELENLEIVSGTKQRIRKSIEYYGI